MIPVECYCGFKEQVPANLAGKKISCKKCGAIVSVLESPAGPFAFQAAPQEPAQPQEVCQRPTIDLAKPNDFERGVQMAKGFMWGVFPLVLILGCCGCAGWFFTQVVESKSGYVIRLAATNQYLDKTLVGFGKRHEARVFWTEAEAERVRKEFWEIWYQAHRGKEVPLLIVEKHP